VTEEPVAEPLAVGRPLDQPGDVGHGEVGGVVDTDHAQVGLEGGEGIVGDLRPGSGHSCDEGGLAGVRHPHQGDVGDQRQLEVVPLLVADLALLGEGRGTPPVGEEPGVAATAPTALGRLPAGSGDHQVGKDRPVAVQDPGPHRHGDLEVGSPGPVLLLATAVPAVTGSAVGVVTEGEERGVVGRRHQPHVATSSAVAAVGPTAVNMRLAPERHRAGSTVAGLDVDLRLVDEG
jgi:hypothetical protein